MVSGTPVLALDGGIDLATVPVLHDQLNRLLRDHPAGIVAIDLDAVVSIDDCALGLLLGAAGRARTAGGDVVIVASSDRLRERLSVTGFDRAVDVRRSLGDG